MRKLVVLLVLALLAVALGCETQKDSQSVGGIVIVVETDLAIPQDLDFVDLTVTRDGQRLLDQHVALGQGEGKLALPARFEVRGARGTPVTIQAVGRKDGRARIVRDAVTPLPSSGLVQLKIPLAWLCDNTAVEPQPGTVESTCPDGLTCVEGSCLSVQVPPEDLTPVDPSSGPVSPNGSPTTGCFDPQVCFATGVTELPLEMGDCSVATPTGATAQTLNLGLLEKVAAGATCTTANCLKVLDADGSTGWNPTGGALGARIRLHGGVCAALSKGKTFVVVASISCATKLASKPQCAATSTPVTPPDILPTCAGFASLACGNCGMQYRTCVNGAWTEYGACQNEGACKIGASEPCGNGGSRACNGTCQWEACLGQKCNANEQATRTCTKCGTETRTCENGEWSEYGACLNQKECEPTAVEACTVGQSTGTRVCGTSCTWGTCGGGGGTLNCTGDPTRPCGTKCGVESRTCNTTTGVWSGWSTCQNEGACSAGQSRSCGVGGTQLCSNTCTWGACEGETGSCIGNGGATIAHGANETQGCTLCGTQTRTCNNRVFTGWSACSNQGVCATGTISACPGGTMTCNGTCQYDACVPNGSGDGNEITSFIIGSGSMHNVHGHIIGTVINVTVPIGTSLTSLPTIIQHEGTSISPPSGAAQNFTSPVIYTVTGPDPTRQYTVNVATGTVGNITAYSVAGVNGVFGGTTQTPTIKVYLPNGSSSLNATPTVTFTGSTLAPPSGSPYNFNNLVLPTLAYASNGSSRSWNVSVGHRVRANLTASAYGPIGIALRWRRNFGDTALNLIKTTTIATSGVIGPQTIDLYDSPLHTGGDFDVTISSQPPGHTCSVANATGTMGVNDITNINISCTP